MMAHQRHVVEKAETRLDRYLLGAYPWLDRGTVEELIATGQVRCNGHRTTKGTKVATGDVVDCREIPEPADLGLRPNPGLPLHLLYHDEELLAVDKPAGQPTHPLRPSETDTLANALVARFPALAGIGPDRLFPALLHRLDTQTSGVLLAARTPAAYAALRAQFRRRTVEKHYTALVLGRVETPGRLDAPLRHQMRSPCRMAVVQEPESGRQGEVFPAVTSWVPLETGCRVSLLDVTIRSGVTHQIRCHLAAARHPVVGDAVYGGEPAGTGRHWLHAAAIRFVHPGTSREMEIRCPLPPGWPPVQ